MMDDISEQNEIAEEISSALSQPIGFNQELDDVRCLYTCISNCILVVVTNLWTEFKDHTKMGGYTTATTYPRLRTLLLEVHITPFYLWIPVIIYSIYMYMNYCFYHKSCLLKRDVLCIIIQCIIIIISVSDFNLYESCVSFTLHVCTCMYTYMSCTCM